MKLLTSGWFLAIFSSALYLGSSAMLIMRGLTSMPELGGIPQREVTALPPRLWTFQTEAVDELIAQLKTGREKLDVDKKNLTLAKTQADTEKAELEKLRTEIQGLREEIDLRVVEIQDIELKNLKTLAQTYTAMAPSSAVAIFLEMDENMVVKILSCMKVDRVGPILGEMGKGPEKPGEESRARRAARITDKLRLIKPLKKDNPV